MQSEPRQLKLGTVLLGVRDLARSLAFYRDVLRLPVQFSSEEFAFLDLGGVALALRALHGVPAPAEGVTELVFHVEDVDEAYRELQSRGVVFRIAPRVVTPDRFAADFRDPDGHVLSILGPRKSGPR